MSVPSRKDAGTPTIDYEGRRFEPLPDRADTARRGHAAGNADTPLGHYHQAEDLVWAEFSGGTVRSGRLVGTCRQDGTVDAAYCMVTHAGATRAGTCVSTPTVLDDGRVRLTEYWHAADGSSGVSRIEEVLQR